MKMILYSDGGARGNPGPAAIGVYLHNPKKTYQKEYGVFIGHSTNNEAEYSALIKGLEFALDKGTTEIECKMDSEFVVKQLKGEYKIKNSRMKILWTKAKNLEKEFKKVTYKYISRDKNKVADRLVNEVLEPVAV